MYNVYLTNYLLKHKPHTRIHIKKCKVKLHTENYMMHQYMYSASSYQKRASKLKGRLYCLARSAGSRVYLQYSKSTFSSLSFGSC